MPSASADTSMEGTTTTNIAGNGGGSSGSSPGSSPPPTPSANLSVSSSSISAYESVSFDLMTTMPYSSVYWYVAVSGDSGLGSNVKMDSGGSSSYSASLSYSFSTSGDYVITAYIYNYLDSSTYEVTHDVSVSGSSSSSNSDDSSSDDSSSTSASTPSYTPPPSGTLSGSSSASAGDSVTIDLSTDTAFSSVYWYVADPGAMSVGSYLEMDTGGSSSRSASFTHTFGSSAFGYYTITAYIYNYSDNSAYEVSHTVYVSGNSW